MKALITLPGQAIPKVVEIDPEKRVGSLVQLVPEAVGNSDTYQDFEITLKNQKDDLDKGIFFGDLLDKIDKKLPHFLISQCKKVTVKVNYAGRCVEKTFPSAFSIEKIDNKIFKEFGIEGKDRKGLFFWIENNPIHQEAQTLLGGLTEYPNCSVELRLGTKKDINGFKGSEEIFKDHIKSQEFELLLALGVVELVENAANWPLFFLRFRSLGNLHYTVKFDLTNYPSQAPKACFWDENEDAFLDYSSWPKFNPRCVQIFRSDWHKQNGGFYHPCDHSALSTHPAWNGQYPHEKWQEDDTILKYVNEIIDALNRLS